MLITSSNQASELHEKFKIIIFSFFATVFVYYSNEYVFIYCCLLFVLALPLLNVRNVFFKVINIFLLVYLGIALLNISDYRGDVSIDTIKLYFYCVVAFFSPLVVLCRFAPLEIKKNVDYYQTDLFKFMMYGHLVVVYLLVFYVYATKGLVIIYQDLRFGIPTSIGYAIRSCQFIPLIFLIVNKGNIDRKFSLVTVLCILPSFLIGSRSTGLLVIFSMMLMYVIFKGPELLVRAKGIGGVKIGFYSFLISFAMIGGGFYLRRAYSPDLLTGPEMIDIYFGGNHSLYIYILLPFHQGFNETAALTSRIIDYGITNTFSTTALFFADFDNLLGLSNVAAAQYFGDEIGRVGDGGLTPGIIGGLYMDYGYATVAIMFLFGLFYSFIINMSSKNKTFLCVTCIFATQFMHLFHRGFVKPEYFTIFIIAIIYCSLLKPKRIIK